MSRWNWESASVRRAAERRKWEQRNTQPAAAGQGDGKPSMLYSVSETRAIRTEHFEYRTALTPVTR